MCRFRYNSLVATNKMRKGALSLAERGIADACQSDLIDRESVGSAHGSDDLMYMPCSQSHLFSEVVPGLGVVNGV